MEDSINEEKIKKHYDELQNKYMENYHKLADYCKSLDLNDKEIAAVLMHHSSSYMMNFFLVCDFTNDELDDFFESFKENYLRIKAEHEQ